MWKHIVISSVYLGCLKLQTQLWLCLITPGTDGKLILMLSPLLLRTVKLYCKVIYPMTLRREILCGRTLELNRALLKKCVSVHESAFVCVGVNLTHLAGSSPGLRGFLPVAQHQCCKPCTQTPINQSWLLTWADSSCLTGTRLPQLFSPSP